MNTSWCTHLHVSEPVEGSSVCLGCGAAVRPMDPVADLIASRDQLLKDYHGHVAGCVETDLGWVCAEGCRASR